MWWPLLLQSPGRGYRPDSSTIPVPSHARTNPICGTQPSLGSPWTVCKGSLSSMTTVIKASTTNWPMPHLGWRADARMRMTYPTAGRVAKGMESSESRTVPSRNRSDRRGPRTRPGRRPASLMLRRLGTRANFLFSFGQPLFLALHPLPSLAGSWSKRITTASLWRMQWKSSRPHPRQDIGLQVPFSDSNDGRGRMSIVHHDVDPPWSSTTTPSAAASSSG